LPLDVPASLTVTPLSVNLLLRKLQQVPMKPDHLCRWGNGPAGQVASR